MKNIIKSLLLAFAFTLTMTGIFVAPTAFASTYTLRFVQTPTITLYTSLSAAGTSARVTPYPRDLDGTKLTMNDFGSSTTLTVDPKVKNLEEIIGFTGITDNGDNTATLTGLTRDLLSRYPYTTVGTGRQHSSSAIVVFSNNPQMYNRFAAPENDASITGIWSFASTSAPKYDLNLSSAAWTASASSTLASKGYVDSVSIAGAANATISLQGLVQLASSTKAASSTVTGSTGANDVLWSKYATDTPQNCSGLLSGGCVIMSLMTGKLNQAWLDLTAAFTWTGAQTFNTATTTFNATSSFNGNIAYANYTYLSVYGTGSDASTTLDGTVTATWASKSSNTYTLTRDVNITNLTIASGITLVTANFRVYGTGKLNNIGTISNNGTAGSSPTAGTNTTTGTLFAGLAGGNGGSENGGAGTAGSNSIHSIGGFGAAGGTGFGANLGGATSSTSTAAVSPNLLQSLYMLDQSSSGTAAYEPGAGGGGGVGGGNTVGWKGGGGGAGGGIVFLSFLTVVNTGTISANGGVGSACSGSGSGGGGGGGGGSIVIVSRSHTNSGTESVTAGTGGSGACGGTNGGTGQIGNVYIISG